MKVIYFAHSLLSRGGDKMVLAHAGWLAAQGHEVEICCNVVDTVLEIPVGVCFSSPSWPGTAGTIMSALLERRDADLVLASIIPMACFLFPRSGRKVIYFAQDYDESYYTSRFLKVLVRCFYIMGLQLFRIPTIAVSHGIAELLHNRFGAGVEVVENGVDANVFYPEANPAIVAAKGKRKAVLLLSRNDPRKGFDVARGIIRNIVPAHAECIEVWTVGEPCKGIFPGLVHNDFGYVGEGKLRTILSSADVFLYPSRHEGLPLMPLEAMACGCPVVTTIAVPFAVNGENALVAQIEDSYALTDHLCSLLEDQVLWSFLSEEGKKFANKYSLMEAKQKFEAVLSRMV